MEKPHVIPADDHHDDTFVSTETLVTEIFGWIKKMEDRQKGKTRLMMWLAT